MLSIILYQMQEFERGHGVAANVVYINPVHYEALFRENPELFEPGQDVRLGFRMVIVPSSCLAHPEASLLENLRPAHQDDPGIGGRDVTDQLPVVA